MPRKFPDGIDCNNSDIDSPSLIRWDTSHIPANQGELGMDNTTGRPVFFRAGLPRLVAALDDIPAPTPQIFAATRVVSSGGDGTDLTIQSAFNNLPPEGGYVYVKQGTYAPAVFPDKNVVLRGSGWGTKIQFSTAGASLSVPNGLTDVRLYVVEDIELEGTGVNNQAGVEINDTNARGIVVLRRVKTEGIQIPINITAGDSSFIRPVLVFVEDSWFRPLASGNSILCSSNGISELIFAHFSRVMFMEDLASTTGGTLNGNTFGNIDYVFEDSFLSVTGDDGFSSIRAKNTWIFNNDTSVFPTIYMIGNPSMSDSWPSVLDSCLVYNLKLSSAETMVAVGGAFRDCEVQVGGAPMSLSVFHGVRVMMDSAFQGNYAFILDLPAKISSCRFAAPLGTPTAYIKINGGDSRIEANVFDSLTAVSMAGIMVGNPFGTGGRGNKFYGNQFANGFACPPIFEDNSAKDNMYFGNSGYQSSVFKPESVVEGSQRIQKTYTTTDSFVQLVGVTNSQGQNFLGTIRNTGVNSMDVREFATDLFGTSDTKVTTVGPGADLILSGDQTVGTARPPYSLYRVEVKSTAIGLSTTAELRGTARTPMSTT
jgi:hypothetical protein